MRLAGPASYINASPLAVQSRSHNNTNDAPPLQPQLILTQYPLKTTYADFWQMALAERSPFVVHLGSPPTSYVTGHCQIQSFQNENCGLSLLQTSFNTNEQTTVISRQLQLWSDDAPGDSHHLEHLNLCEWPDFGVPSAGHTDTYADVLLKLLTRPTANQNAGASCAPIIHCMAGMGRSGTFALAYLLAEAQMENPIEDYEQFAGKALEILEYLRMRQRPGLVETFTQFEYALALSQTVVKKIPIIEDKFKM